MMEPLSVGIHSVSTLGKCKANQVVIVFGAGPVGLLCMAVAKALGARRVIAVDIQKERLDFAKSYAADDIFIPVRLSSVYSRCTV
jgi:L-iditol 2-dehydrogenase/D-xylulose reductase